MVHAASPLPFGLGFFTAPPSARAERSSLRDDERGAVMMTGLFMAFFLVGALWYVIGIGDAVIFRDRMQEAADHSAFTSAALHAKGMNFISACNIVMLILVAVHILLGIIHDFALAACILSLGTGCGGWLTARRIYTGYEKFFKPALSVIHYLEMGAGFGYPYIGAVKGYQIGSKYGNQGKVGSVISIPLSTSMIPGPLVGSAKTGLPVIPVPYDMLCQKLADMIFDWAKKNIPLPGLGFVGGIVHSLFGGETVEDIVKKIIGAGIKLRYCNDLSLGKIAEDPFGTGLYKQMARGENKIKDQNRDTAEHNKHLKNGEQPGKMLDDPQIRRGTGDIKDIGGEDQKWHSILDPGFDRGWGHEGPYVVNFGAGNGTDQMFVWSINIHPRYRETSERRVNVPGDYKHVMGDSSQGPFGYFAEAEFYFDCEDVFSNEECNGKALENSATFAIKWRARLRHLELPNLGALLADFGLDAIMNSNVYQEIRKKLTDENEVFTSLSKGPLSAIGIKALKEQLNAYAVDFENAVYGGAEKALGMDTSIEGAFH